MTDQIQTVAFLGLGVMGYPMAGHLARAGYEVRVFNRTAAKAIAWIEEFGAVGTANHGAFSTPAEAVHGADMAFICVGAGPDVEQVCFGPGGIAETASAHMVVVDHTTISARETEEIAGEFKKIKIGFVDAPVSGGEKGAVDGKLTAMCGGDDTDFNQAKKVIKSYAMTVKHMGPVGAGQKAKMVNQICIAGVLQGLAEGLLFAEGAGLDPMKVVDVIRNGAAQSWQMENRAATMVDGIYDFGFAVNWMRKDLGIVLDEARGLNLSLPLTALIDQFYGDLQHMGAGRYDTSSLIERLRHLQKEI